MTKTTTAHLGALARSARHGFERTKKGRADFISGTFELARALSAARRKLRSDLAFHDWIVNKAGLKSISKDDRAALICIGDNVMAARKLFAEGEDDLWSWRTCATRLRINAAVSRSTSVSQPAIPARRLAVHVSHGEPMNIVALADITQAARPALMLVSVNEPEPKPKPKPPPHALHLELPETARQHSTIGIVQAVVEASELSTGAVALYWQTIEDRPSPDAVREAARWLELLADALEDEGELEPRHH